MFDLFGETFAARISEYSDKIASEFISGKIKELSEEVAKIAAENEYNVEQIKRLIESTNLAVYRKMFEAKEASGDKDRIIEFKIAELKDVLDKVREIDTSCSDEASSCSSNKKTIKEKIMKMFPDIEDMMNKGKGKIEVHKDVKTFKSPDNKSTVTVKIIKLNKISSDIENEVAIKQAEYNELVNELANCFASIYSFDIDKFASGVLGAACASGSETGFATKIMADIYSTLKREPGATKIASEYTYLPEKELGLFKKAMECLRLIDKYEDVNKRIKVMIRETENKK